MSRDAAVIGPQSPFDWNPFDGFWWWPEEMATIVLVPRAGTISEDAAFRLISPLPCLLHVLFSCMRKGGSLECNIG